MARVLQCGLCRVIEHNTWPLLEQGGPRAVRFYCSTAFVGLLNTIHGHYMSEVGLMQCISMPHTAHAFNAYMFT